MIYTLYVYIYLFHDMEIITTNDIKHFFLYSFISI